MPMRSPWVKTFLVINIFIFLSSAISFSTWRGISAIRERWIYSQESQITEIVQTSSEREALPTLYLAELMGLSKDKPSYMMAFDLDVAKERLIQSPVIANADVKLRKPQSVYVDYEVKRPIAYLSDIRNLVFDETGSIFPLRPYFAPKKLPHVYIGAVKVPLTEIEKEKQRLALEVMGYFYRATSEMSISLLQIDLCNCNHESLGKQEIIMKVEYNKQKHFLRLSSLEYRKEFSNYLEIKDKLVYDYNYANKLMIDFRLSDLAYVDVYP